MNGKLATRLALTLWAALASSGCAARERVKSPDVACTLATERVTAHRGLPVSHVVDCDNIPEADGLSSYYILALLADCHEEMCGSTNMGWFAVSKATGEVFDWNVADSKLGRAIPAPR